jgi:hypothetical protein
MEEYQGALGISVGFAEQMAYRSIGHRVAEGVALRSLARQTA